ncbi:MAG: transglutaminase domain-containing protein [Gemmatimonadales bacterium]|nr:transglutaminase domain-containing protein [Gemmatimonadales bacterium]
MSSYRPTLRALAAVAVLTAWGGSLTWLGLRRLDAGATPDLSLLASRRLAPGEARFAVQIGDVQIGSGGLTLDTLSPGYRIVETLTLETRGDTALSRALRMTETELAPDLTLRQVRSRFVRPGLSQSGLGRYADGRLTFRYDSGGTGSAVLDSTTPAVPIVALAYQLAIRGELRIGRNGRDLTTGGWPSVARNASWKVTGDTTLVFPDSAEFDPRTLRWKAVHWDTARVVRMVVTAPTGPYTAWVEQNGTLAGIEYPLGTRWIRTDFNLAVSAFRRTLDSGRDAIRSVLPLMEPYATSVVRRDTATTERRFLVTRASSREIDLAALAQLAGARQRVSHDTLSIGPTTFADGLTPTSDVATDPLVQRDAAPLVALARDVSRSGDRAAIVARLANVVAAKVALDTAYGAPVDALGCLHARRCRPDGIARLFVAVARELGIPARYVVGFAAIPGGVATHAWSEVWYDGGAGWVAVDPVMGRAVASTALVRIGFGGSSHPEELLTSLADVRLIPLPDVRTP